MVTITFLSLDCVQHTSERDWWGRGLRSHRDYELLSSCFAPPSIPLFCYLNKTLSFVKRVRCGQEQRQVALSALGVYNLLDYKNTRCIIKVQP